MIESIKEKSELEKNNELESWEALQDLKEKIKENYPYLKMIENQKEPITRWNREKPEISLTFDDGYGKWNIKEILDILENSEIQATFFILWDCLQLTPDLWKKAIDQWHQICCHSFTHIYLSNKSDTTSLSSWLNKNVNISTWQNNVKRLLWEDYYKQIKSESWSNFPYQIKSDLLLETEILMWEQQIKKTLWTEYFHKMKQNFPFFRFPGWCWATRPENIKVLKKLWYLSIWWSEDFYRNRKWNRHLSTDEIKNMNIWNWEIPLFHFKYQDFKYINAYIDNYKNKGKSSRKISDIVRPKN